MAFKLVIDPKAIIDIQQVIDYLDEKQTGLGKQFESNLNEHVLALKKNPFFRIRYDIVRCLPLKKFSYMIHFTVDEQNELIIIRAVFHTSRNTKNWEKRKY